LLFDITGDGKTRRFGVGAKKWRGWIVSTEGDGVPQKAICDPGTTWSLQDNMILPNEPKVLHAGLGFLKKRTQNEPKFRGVVRG
jgi:hypothetical protein